MKEKIKNNIFISIIFTIILYVALAFYGNYNLVFSTLKTFQWTYLLLILLVIYFTFLLKFLKWHYYLNLININIKLSHSFQIFMASLTMSVTPGKIGELIKPYMIKEINGTSISKTVPIVFAERVTEFTALLFIIAFGIKVFNHNYLILVITLFLFLLLLVFILNKRISGLVLSKLNRIHFLKKYVDPINISFSNSRDLLEIKPFALMFLFSLLIWLIEAFGFYVIFIGFNLDISIIWAYFTYLFSVFVGSIAIIPAGLGVTDGSITFLLSQNELSKDISVSIALIIRIATLWFALLIGAFHMLMYNSLVKLGNKG